VVFLYLSLCSYLCSYLSSYLSPNKLNQVLTKLTTNGAPSSLPLPYLAPTSLPPPSFPRVLSLSPLVLMRDLTIRKRCKYLPHISNTLATH